MTRKIILYFKDMPDKEDKEFILKIESLKDSIESFRKTLEEAITYCDALMKEFYEMCVEDGDEQ